MPHIKFLNRCNGSGEDFWMGFTIYGYGGLGGGGGAGGRDGGHLGHVTWIIRTYFSSFFARIST